MNEVLMSEDIVLKNAVESAEVLGLAGGIIGFFLAFAVLFAIIGLISYIVTAVTYMKLAEKAGVENKLMAWIPFLGPNFLVLKIVGFNPLLVFVPLLAWLIGVLNIPFLSLAVMLAQIVWFIFLDMKLFDAFGKNKNLGLIHLIPGGSLVVIIMIMVMAFGQTEYAGSSAEFSSDYEY